MPPEGNGSSVRERARTGGGVDPQEGMLDLQWDDANLEAALEEREAARVARTDAAAEFKIKNDNAKALLVNFHLAVGEVARCGRFRIKKTQVAGNSVAFDTAPREQLSIKAEGGGEE